MVSHRSVLVCRAQEWSNSNNQSDRFFGDEVDQCFYVDLAPGNTMLIPTGWIHAVLTPEDSLVFGGNFLHGYDVRGQLRVFELERQTSVPRKFRFPMYEHLQWYAAGHYLKVGMRCCAWCVCGRHRVTALLQRAHVQFLRHPEFSKALEDTLAGGTQATAGTEGTLAAVGISRFELVGISALLKLLREIQRRSGVKRKAIRIVKKSEVRHPLLLRTQPRLTARTSTNSSAPAMQPKRPQRLRAATRRRSSWRSSLAGCRAHGPSPRHRKHRHRRSNSSFVPAPAEAWGRVLVQVLVQVLVHLRAPLHRVVHASS